MTRIPVVSENNVPLMPVTYGKVTRLLNQKKAVLRTNKLGIKYLQLLIPAAQNIQPLVLASDPGSKYDGVAVGSKDQINLTGMFALPKTVARKMNDRRDMRKARRFRNTPCRKKRFNNRARSVGWIAPSQKAKVDFRLLIIKRLSRIYPIETYLVEDVKFDHYRKKWGKFFSTVEIGKTYLYNEVSKMGKLIKSSGSQTKNALDNFGIKKISAKARFVKESHANDCVAMLCDYFGRNIPDRTNLHCWKRYEFHRRQIHRREPSKGGIRERYGGSWLVASFYKGDVVTGTRKKHPIKGLACSFDSKGNGVGIATFEKSQKWIVPLRTIQRLYHNPVLVN